MIVDMGILNKQCEIYKLCMLIVLAGVAFSQQVFFKFFVVSLCIFKVNETEKRINEIKLRKKRDELFVLSPSGYIYICCNRSLSSTFPLFFSIPSFLF